MTMPPNHTHQTSGLKVMRISALSLPVTPANTTYTSCFGDSRMPTSVDGSNVGWSAAVDVLALLAT